MKVDGNELKKQRLGLALFGLLASNAFAVSVEPLKHEELKTANIMVSNSFQESIHRAEKKSTYHSPDTLLQHKNFALVDSIKSDGQLFFEMRSDHSLASESSAVALLILGLLGFFSRRWS